MRFSKGFIVVFSLALLMLCPGCAGSSAYMKDTKTLLQPRSDKALVHFIRPSGFGCGINFNMLDGNKVIGNSVAMSQFGYLAEPGKHLFIATAENKAFLEADLEAGKTYYVITRVYSGAWSARVAFVAVNKDSEYWDKIKGWEESLKIVEPDLIALKKWEDAHKPQIEALISQYDAKWKNSYAWPTLKPEDGR